jgi:aminomethyltransferase
MSQRTPLYDAHVAAGARMVNFSGWEMPINYGSQIEEHHAVRSSAGMFDVSHMAIVDIKGSQARHFLSYLLANDVAKLKAPGRVMYTCMLSETGGVIDDLLAYFINEEFFRLVVNAATRDKDMAWINAQARAFDVSVTERTDLAMIAVQGPTARQAVLDLLPDEDAVVVGQLKPFWAALLDDYFIARTGYTGEEGFEITLPNGTARGMWDKLLAAGVAPCGLGARDTLRLEAGMSLYGQDMDENVTPLESGLAWTVAMKDERAFVGKDALLKQKEQGLDNKLVGLVLEDRGVLRPGQRVVSEAGKGVTTSGSFSPTIGKAIALARVPKNAAGNCQVDVRGKLLDCRIVTPPFVRLGKVCEGIV